MTAWRRTQALPHQDRNSASDKIVTKAFCITLLNAFFNYTCDEQSMSIHDHLSLKPSWLPNEARVVSRVLIHLPVFLRAPGGDPFSATVVDIATHGFRVRSGYPAKLGQFLAIEVPAFARYSGWVAWAHSGEFGFDVANPLPEPVVGHILGLALQD